MATETNLNNLTDMQKITLTELAYIDIDGLTKNQKFFFNSGKLTVGDLLESQKERYTNYTGNISEKEVEKQLEVIKSLELKIEQNESLKNLKITGYKNDNNVTGFVGFAFKDAHGNVGFSYRGSEVDTAGKGVRDYADNISTGLIGNSPQSILAQKFFDEYKNKDGNNYTFGHSKAGEVTTKLFIENLDEIKRTFIINGQPVHPDIARKALKELHDPNRFESVNIEGDFVNDIGFALYPSRTIGFSKRDNEYGFMDPHGIGYVLFNEDGSFADPLPGNQFFKQNVAGLALTALTTAAQVYLIEVKLIADIAYFLIDTTLKGIELLYEQFIAKAIDYIGKVVRKIEIELKEVFQAIKEGIKSIFKKSINKGYVAIPTPEIKVDTELLKDLAQRLERVRNRLTALDGDLNYLYLTEPLTVIKNLLKANMLLPSKRKVNGCIDYLEGTAIAFEKAEKNIKALV